MDTSAKRNPAARAVKQKLEDLARAGVTHLPRAVQSAPHANEPRTAAEPSAPAAPEPAPRSAGTAAAGPPAVEPAASLSLFDQMPTDPAVPAQERPALLKAISSEVAQCRRCAALVSCRTQTVFGVGNVEAELCFVGEAPGRDEDAQGEPFVGQAGRLLNKIIVACKLRREDVYICNILKCRPPDNRTPLPDEAANCRPFLERQLGIIRPKFICALGGVAAQNLLGMNQSMGKLRGRFFPYGGAQLTCTYHPAYLLRNPAAKAMVWEDMKKLMAAMGRPLE